MGEASPLKLEAELETVRVGDVVTVEPPYLVDAGWSQASAAAVDEDTVLHLEQTRCDPRVSTIVRLAYALGRRVRVELVPTVVR